MNALLAFDTDRIATSRQLEEQQPLRVCFEFYGVRARVCTNSSHLADHLRLGYRFFEVTGYDEAPHVSLLALEAGAPQYRACVDALFPSYSIRDHILTTRELGLVFLLGSPALLSYYTVKVLFDRVMGLLRARFVAFHAATLACQNRGLVLCGAARCGKTLLTSLLMEKDFQCCSDDVTLLMRSPLKVRAFPRALTIRREYESLLTPLLAKARRMQRMTVADQERLLVDLEYPAPPSVEPCVICLPRFEAMSSTRLQAMSPATALVALMHHRFHPLVGSIHEQDEQDFAVLSDLLNQVPCFSLRYGDPFQAAASLKELLG